MFHSLKRYRVDDDHIATREQSRYVFFFTRKRALEFARQREAMFVDMKTEEKIDFHDDYYPSGPG